MKKMSGDFMALEIGIYTKLDVHPRLGLKVKSIMAQYY